MFHDQFGSAGFLLFTLGVLLLAVYAILSRNITFVRQYLFAEQAKKNVLEDDEGAPSSQIKGCTSSDS